MNRHMSRWLGAMALGALLLQPVSAVADPPAHARNEKSSQQRGYAAHGDRRDDDRGDYRWREGRYDDRDDDRRGEYDRRHWETRHYHDDRGHVVHRLPPRHRVVHHHGHRYYYSQGLWYRPRGPLFVVVDPPLGLVLSFLPEFGATVFFGGVPHYRAGPVYYVWNPRLRGYVVTDRMYYRL